LSCIEQSLAYRGSTESLLSTLRTYPLGGLAQIYQDAGKAKIPTLLLWGICRGAGGAPSPNVGSSMRSRHETLAHREFDRAAPPDDRLTSGSRLQELGERLECRLGDVVLHPFGVGFGSLYRHAEREQHIDDKPMAGSDLCRKPLALLGQKNTSVRAACCQAFALQSRDRFDRSRMGYAQPASNVRGARFSAACQQICDKLDVVLEQGAGLGRTRLAEPAGLGQFSRQFDRELDPFCPLGPRHIPSRHLNLTDPTLRRITEKFNTAIKVFHQLQNVV
jgi:LSD1 subclass zinc finger protein